MSEIIICEDPDDWVTAQYYDNDAEANIRVLRRKRAGCAVRGAVDRGELSEDRYDSFMNSKRSQHIRSGEQRF